MLLNELIGNEYLPCSRTSGVKAAKQLFQEGIPYTRVKLIQGGYKYIWEQVFVQKVIDALESTEIPSLSAKEQHILTEYIQLINYGVTAETSEAVLDLDRELGEMI